MRRPSRPTPFLARALAALAASTFTASTLAACFSESPPPAGPVAPATGTVSAAPAANVFSPQTFTVARGGSVTWTFGARPHNVTFVPTTGAPANIPNMTNGEASRLFTTTGTFAYTCTLHAGMIGTVIVQ